MTTGSTADLITRAREWAAEDPDAHTRAELEALVAEVEADPGSSGAGDLADRFAGRLEFEQPDNCSCHIAPPCGACTSVKLFCPACQWVDGDDVPAILAVNSSARVYSSFTGRRSRSEEESR